MGGGGVQMVMMIHSNNQLLSPISIKYLETQIHTHNNFHILPEVTAGTDKTNTMPDEKHNYRQISIYVIWRTRLVAAHLLLQAADSIRNVYGLIMLVI
jgi:hypothetical protein